MFLHAGNHISVKKDEIIGIFDLDTASMAKTTRDFLSNAEKKGSVINVSSELPKSFIVSKKRNQTTVYISPISAQTLTERYKDSLESK